MEQEVKRIRTSVPLPESFDHSMGELPDDGIFCRLSEEALERLASYGEFFSASAGARVVEQDRYQDSLYFILSGEFEVSYVTSEDRNLLATLGPGEVVGEANLFVPGDATATVYVSKDCNIWRIDKTQISKFIIAYPSNGLAIVAEIIDLLSGRIKRLNKMASRALDFYNEYSDRA